MSRNFRDKRGGGALWITLREAMYWGSAAVLSPMLAYTTSDVRREQDDHHLIYFKGRFYKPVEPGNLEK